NCPNVGKWQPDDKRPASIQRATPNGKVEIVATEADGVAFDGPNDLTYGPDGRLYFTDSGDWDPETKRHKGRIVVIEKDGTAYPGRARSHLSQRHRGQARRLHRLG